MTKYSELKTESHVLRMWAHGNGLIRWIMYTHPANYLEDSPAGSGEAYDFSTVIEDANRAGLSVWLGPKT